MVYTIVLALDPGNVYTAYVLLNEKCEIIDAKKILNHELLKVIIDYSNSDTYFVYEMIKSQGMAVGQTVFDTCTWIGRFIQLAIECKYKLIYPIYRFEEKQWICNSARAKDTNIKMALITRFAKHDFLTGKGKKDNKDFFYNIKADMWMAFAVAITFLDKLKEGKVDPKDGQS